MRQSNFVYAPLRLLPIVSLTCVLTGCSASTDRYQPAKGRVLVGGRPAVGAKVILVPRDDYDSYRGNPAGKVGEDGYYQLATYDPATRVVHDGARPGEYRVLVTWVVEPTLRSLDIPGGDKLGNRFRDPKTTTLSAQINDGVAELPPIQLAETELKSRSR